jgi:esterase/lipase superfamily enzyme
MGTVARPWRVLGIALPTRYDRHFVLERVHVLSADDWMSGPTTTSPASTKRRAMLFVHGYLNTFEDVALRAAQLAIDLDFQGHPFFFSWPSLGLLHAYTRDSNTADLAVVHLTEVILRLSGSFDEVYLVAHSMGARITAAALRNALATNPSIARAIREVVLAAPDIDAELFQRDVAPILRTAGLATTLYANSNDKALMASRQVWGAPRAGDSADGLVLSPGIESIDATHVDTDLLGHSTAFVSRPVITDLALLTSRGLRANERPGLERLANGRSVWWRFKR